MYDVFLTTPPQIRPQRWKSRRRTMGAASQVQKMSMSPGRHFPDLLGTAHLTATEPAMSICEAILLVSMTMRSWAGGWCESREKLT